MRRAAVALAGLVGVALAGCVGTQESTACGYASAHFTQAPEAAELRDAFEQAGHAWRETDQEGVAEVRTRADRLVTVSVEPGTSGPDLVLSADAPTPLEAQTAVNGLAAIVNETAPQAELVRWVQESRACPDTGGGGKPGAPGEP